MSMKIDEVMLGDIVSAGGRPIHVTLAVLNNWSDNIKPIPLTPEILEKNGFIQDTNYSFRFFSPKVYKTIDIGVDFTIKGFTFWYSDAINISCGNGSKINRLPCFVHELQHALKLCKIYKEIVV